jgi:hypothetical protein
LLGVRQGWVLIIGQSFLDTDEGSLRKQKEFFFEKQWLLKEDFMEKNLRQVAVTIGVDVCGQILSHRKILNFRM